MVTTSTANNPAIQLAPPRPVGGGVPVPIFNAVNGSDIPELDPAFALPPASPVPGVIGAVSQPPAQPSADGKQSAPAPISPLPTPAPQTPVYKPSLLTKMAGFAAKAAPIAGAVGNAVGAAMGTPEEKQVAEQNSALSVQIPKIQAETQATLAENELRRKQAELMGQMATITLANGQVMQIPMSQVGNFAKGGLAADINTQGKLGVEAMKEEAERDLKAAQAAHQKAQADLLTNPNNPTFQQNERKIRAMLAIAQQRVALANQGMALHQREFEINNYGVDPATGQSPPGTLVDENNTPIGKNNAQNVRPTTVARGKAEQATAIEEAAIPLMRDINAIGPQVFGPVLGRFGSLEKFIGDPPPEYAKLAGELMSWIALHPAAHGFRGMQAVQEFEKAFGNPHWTPESLSAAISGSFGTMDALRKVGTPRTVTGGGPQSQVPQSITGAVNSQKVLSPADMQKATPVLYRKQKAYQSGTSVYGQDGHYLGEAAPAGR